jgi:transcriptional repressor NrdR
MVCPFCLHKKTDIYNTRKTGGGATVWRRRRCLSCQSAFTTQEHFDPSGVWKIKGNKKTRPYSRATLSMSILRACDHRSNQDDAAWYLFQTVEQKLTPLLDEKRTLTTHAVIETVAGVLKRFDAAAYVKYISTHQGGLDVATLQRKLRRS